MLWSYSKTVEVDYCLIKIFRGYIERGKKFLPTHVRNFCCTFCCGSKVIIFVGFLLLLRFIMDPDHLNFFLHPFLINPHSFFKNISKSTVKRQTSLQQNYFYNTPLFKPYF